MTLTISGTLRIISPATFSRISRGSRVEDAARASMLSQQRTLICWPQSRLPSRMPVTRFREGSPYTGRQGNLNQNKRPLTSHAITRIFAVNPPRRLNSTAVPRPTPRCHSFPTKVFFLTRLRIVTIITTLVTFIYRATVTTRD